MVTSALVEEREDRIPNMGDLNENEQRKESCAELSGDENQNEETNARENVNEEEENQQKNPEDNVDHQSTSEEGETNSLNSCKSATHDILQEVQCSENLPSSESNKENIDSNILPSNYIEIEPTEYFVPGESNFGEYENADQIPLPQLLKLHVKQLVSGFEYGEATKRRAQENMKTARERRKSEGRKNEEGTVADGEKEQENDLIKPSCSKTLLPETEHKTPHSRKRQRLAEAKTNTVNSDKDFCKVTRRVPDCIVKHPDCKEVWMFMIFKEEATLKLRNPRLFNDFKSVTPRMRAILLDWLMEVAAVYHLRRVTYYLSVDYFDRFLSIRPDIPKSLLQLVGITCLYIAAKVEEIYPPNLSEFSYVCDGACKSKEMVSCELLILNSLGWEVVLTTPTDWLNLYMQLHFKSQDIVKSALNMDFNRDFIFPQYSAYQFTRASQLMDLLSLDPGFLKFGYSVIAAAAMYYMYGEEVALSVSGLSWQELKPCVEYMEVFYTIIKDTPDPRLESCLGGPHPEEANKFSTGLLKRLHSRPKNENYSFQTHVASMEYFEKATIYRLTYYSKQADIQSSDNNLEEVPSVKPDTPDSVKEVVGVHSETEGDEGCEESEEGRECPENIESSIVDDLKSLEELTKNEGDSQENEVTSDDNLMSLDEIFELILNQDDTKSTNSK